MLNHLTEIFYENFRTREELGASLSIWHHGEEILTLAHGHADRQRTRPWSRDTLIPVYSATKVPAAATLLHCLNSRGLDEQTPVTEIWHTFPLKNATIAHLLSHQCGLAALTEKCDAWDHNSVARAIEHQTPEWLPGQAHGYHPRTYGFLLDECVRRLSNKTLGQYWNQEIAAPLSLDFWIGLPSQHHHRVAELVPGRAEKNTTEVGFYKEYMTTGTLTQRAFSSPQGLRSVQEMNDPKAWSHGFPAMGGIGTASALAKFYQILCSALPGPFSEKTLRALATPQSTSHDRILLQATTFTCGAQMDPLDIQGNKMRTLYGSNKNAYGHPGAGGSHAFCDQRARPRGGGGEQRLVACLARCAHRGDDAAARARDRLVARPFEPQLEFAGALAAVDQMRVAVDQPRRQQAALRVDGAHSCRCLR